MKPEMSERLRELADRLDDPETVYVTVFDPPWNMQECGEIAKGLHDMLDERRGAEAEELRAGLEKIMADAPGGDLESNNEWSAELQRLLDEVDARDSLAHLEQREFTLTKERLAHRLAHLEQRELTKERRREALQGVLDPAHVGLTKAWHDELIERTLAALENL